MGFDLVGTEKQVAWAESILADSIASIDSAAQEAPEFAEACQELKSALSDITDSSWVIENRHCLGLATGMTYGGDSLTIDPDSLRQHQLLRDEHWRNPALRKGTANVPSERVERIRAMFSKIQRKQLG